MSKSEETFTEISFLTPNRILTIAGGTVTQLIRMKTFYFLLAFAILIWLSRSLHLPQTPARELEAFKKAAFGSMDVFCWLYAIVASALLIPRDLEDRTLYTIISKPVRRIEYLLGKLLGVLAMVGISLAVMMALCLAVVYHKQQTSISDAVEMAEYGHISKPDLHEQIRLIDQQGVRKELFVAGFAYFLKASVIAAMAIMISTFASSSLFTIITTILFFLIGHVHSMASNFWMDKTDNSLLARLLTKLIKLCIPDFQIFSFNEGLIIGHTISSGLLLGMTVFSVAYISIFMLFALISFLYKEF